jgi:hypothetical protein
MPLTVEDGLDGHNKDGWKVQGKRGEGAGDSPTGEWEWYFGPGTAERNGTVNFQDDRTSKTMSWAGERNKKGSGKWEGPYKQGVLLRWTDGEYKDSIDMLELTEGGKKLKGHNKENLEIEGNRK